MKVLHITAMAEGGAGVACMRQHRALRESGIQSMVLLLMGQGNSSEQIFSLEESDPAFKKTLRAHKRKRALLNIKVRLHGKTPELFSSAESVWKTEEHLLVRQADIIHLHWVAGMIDLNRFFSVVEKPIVWTLHDAWPYSGGFHYERYWNSGAFAGLSSEGIQLRKTLFASRKIQIISPSTYLLNECRSSEVFGAAEFHHVPYCINSFFIRNPEMPETVSENQIWLFLADELSYYRKGAELLLTAFSRWKNEHVKLIVAGKTGNLKLPNDPRIEFPGHLHQDNVSLLMNQVSAVIHTSYEDNQPNVIIESLCAGTPVLATPAGGVPEMITDGVNGILTANYSVDAVTAGFEKLWKLKADRAMISHQAMQHYSPKRLVEQLQTIYARL